MNAADLRGHRGRFDRGDGNRGDARGARRRLRLRHPAGPCEGRRRLARDRGGAEDPGDPGVRRRAQIGRGGARAARRRDPAALFQILRDFRFHRRGQYRTGGRSPAGDDGGHSYRILSRLGRARAERLQRTSLCRRPARVGIAQAVRSADADDRSGPGPRAAAADEGAGRPPSPQNGSRGGGVAAGFHRGAPPTGRPPHHRRRDLRRGSPRDRCADGRLAADDRQRGDRPLLSANLARSAAGSRARLRSARFRRSRAPASSSPAVAPN